MGVSMRALVGWGLAMPGLVVFWAAAMVLGIRCAGSLADRCRRLGVTASVAVWWCRRLNVSKGAVGILCSRLLRLLRAF